MDKHPSPWSVPVAVEDIPDTGLHKEIEAPADIRAELAAFAGIRGLPRLSAAFDLVRRGAQVDVTGRVTALVGQTCVVSLDPMESEVDEPVDLTFAPPQSSQAVAERETAGRDADADEEPPEPLVGGTIDLGAIATEFLVLGIDPYPRKPGVEFAAPKAEDAGGHPFAALAALKKRPS